VAEELTDEEVFGTVSHELTDEEVFGTGSPGEPSPGQQLSTQIQAGALGQPTPDVREVGAGEAMSRAFQGSAAPVIAAPLFAAGGLAGAAADVTANHPVLRRMSGALAEGRDAFFKINQDIRAAGQEATGLAPNEKYATSTVGGAEIPTAELAAGVGGLPAGLATFPLTPLETAPEHLDAGATANQAQGAAAVEGAVNAAFGGLPAALPIGRVKSALFGAAVNPAIGEAGRRAENLVLPEQAQAPFSLPNAVVQAGLGATFGAAGGKKAPAGKIAAKKTDWSSVESQMTKVTDADGNTAYVTPSGTTITAKDWEATTDKVRAQWLKPQAKPTAEPTEHDEEAAKLAELKNSAADPQNRKDIDAEIKAVQKRKADEAKAEAEAAKLTERAKEKRTLAKKAKALGLSEERQKAFHDEADKLEADAEKLRKPVTTKGIEVNEGEVVELGEGEKPPSAEGIEVGDAKSVAAEMQRVEPVEGEGEPTTAGLKAKELPADDVTMESTPIPMSLAVAETAAKQRRAKGEKVRVVEHPTELGYYAVDPPALNEVLDPGEKPEPTTVVGEVPAGESVTLKTPAEPAAEAVSTAGLKVGAEPLPKSAEVPPVKPVAEPEEVPTTRGIEVQELTPDERVVAESVHDSHPDDINHDAIRDIASLAERDPDAAQRLIDEHQSDTAVAKAASVKPEQQAGGPGERGAEAPRENASARDEGKPVEAAGEVGAGRPAEVDALPKGEAEGTVSPDRGAPDGEGRHEGRGAEASDPVQQRRSVRDPIPPERQAAVGAARQRLAERTVTSADEARTLTRKKELVQDPERVGQCNELSCDAVIDGIGGDLLIGRMAETPSSRMWHAVVQFADGSIYDPTYRRNFAPGVLEEIAGFVPVKKMTREELVDHIDRTGHYPAVDTLSLKVPEDAYERAINPVADKGATGAYARKPPSIVRALTDRFGKGIQNLLANRALHVHDSATSRDVPAHIQAKAAADPSMRGIYDPQTKTARLFADRIKPGEEADVLIHEVYHRHEHMLSQRAFDSFMRDVQRLHEGAGAKAEVVQAWERTKNLYREYEEGSEPFLREVAAYITEKYPKSSIARRIISHVKAYLYRMGLRDLDEDAIRGIAAQALRRAMNESPAQARRGVSMASRTEPPERAAAIPVMQEQANAYAKANGLLPYAPESVEIPVGRLMEPMASKVERNGADEKTGLALNKNGTVTLYYHTNTATAREIGLKKVIPAPKGNRINLTTLSSGQVAESTGVKGAGGAVVKVEVDPSLLHTIRGAFTGVKNFFIPVREGALGAKKVQLQAIKQSYEEPILKGKRGGSTLNDMGDTIVTAIHNYERASPADRKATLRRAQETLLREHNIGNDLLGQNQKLEKSEGRDWNGKSVSSQGLGLASAQKITDGLTTCPNSAICKDLCLGETSGGNALYGGHGTGEDAFSYRAGPRLSQYLKTEAMVMHPEEFAIVLHDEINRFKRSLTPDMQAGIRLNQTSDFSPKVIRGLIYAHPDVMFYDYTKLGSEVLPKLDERGQPMRDANGKTIPVDNHHLTYSSTGVSQTVGGERVANLHSNWNSLRAKLKAGKNVAMAFSGKAVSIPEKGTPEQIAAATAKNDAKLPEFLEDMGDLDESGQPRRYKVINGDEYDFRPLDDVIHRKPGEPGVIVGLRNKDSTSKVETVAKKSKGFFVNYDRAEHGPSLKIEPQKGDAGAPAVKLADLRDEPMASRSDPMAARADSPVEREVDFTTENARLREEDRTLWQRAKQTLQRNLAPQGLLPDSTFAAKIERDNNLNAVEFDLRHLVGDYEHAIKQDYGISVDKMSPALRKSMSDSLAGRVDTELPENVREAVYKMRQYIDTMSEQYIRQLEERMAARGDEGDADLIEKITSNLGQYVHRSYKAFDDPEWFKKIPDRVADAARNYLTEGYMEDGMDAVEARRRAEVALHEITKTGTAYDSMESFIAEGKLGAKDLSVLMRRKEIAPEIRALLGEYDDPRVNFAKTATKMGRLIWNQRFLDNVRAHGIGSFLFEGTERPPHATKQIAAEGSESYSPLNGLWTFPEVERAFKDALGKEQMSNWYRTVVKYNGIVKYGKTVLSPTTAMRNFQSAMFFSLGNGHFNPAHIGKAVAAFREQVLHNASGDQLAYMRRMKELGVVYDAANAGEMMRLLSDSRIEDMLRGRPASTAFRKVNDIARGFYSFGDDFWKIIGFENEKASLRKAGLDEGQAEREAAERIRNTYPTYSMTGRGVKFLSRLPLMGTFVSFPAEILRTSYHMIRYAAKDLKSDNPSMRALGMKRLAGIAMVSAGFAAAAQAAKQMFGVSDEEEKAVRDLAPPWSKNSTLLFAGRDEKGNLRYFDLSFLDPYGYFKRPITAALQDKPWQQEATSAARDLLVPFFGEDIAFGAIQDIYNNKTDTGRPVFKSFAPVSDQAADIANHLRKVLQPGFVSNAERIAKAAVDYKRTSGQPYSMEDEMMALLGWRATTFDPKASLYYRSFSFEDAIGQATQTMNEALRSPNSVSDAELGDAYGRATTMRAAAFAEMSNAIAAAKASGVSEDDIYKTLKAGNMSDETVEALLAGEVPKLRLSKASKKGSIERAEAFGAEHVEDMYRRLDAVDQLSEASD
jgi:hypothetical protein